MDATPAGLKQGARNIFKEVAVGLKGSELREVGLANLAAKLVTRVPLVRRSRTRCSLLGRAFL
eukprot:2565013-Prymnesium_polylepis.1